MDRIAQPVLALALTALVVVQPGASQTASCPPTQTFTKTGTIGQVASDPAPASVGISGMGVSRYNAVAGGSQIVWAVGDRSANEIARSDKVFLFGLDARDGSLAIRYPLDPTSFQDDPNLSGTDTVTTLAQTGKPIPDLEELSIGYVVGAPGRIWLFDTGDNTASRRNLNLYAVDEPNLTGVGGGTDLLGSDPELDDAVTGIQLSMTRYPVQLRVGLTQFITNVEAGFVDQTGPGGPVYLIAKSPRDLDHEGTSMQDDFRVFRVTPSNAVSPETPDAMNIASNVSYLEFNDPTLRVTAASMLDDGSQLVVRGVSGGGRTPDTDLEAIYFRDPGSDLVDVFAASRAPACTLSLNTAPKSKREESIAYHLNAGNATGFQGFVWTHDAPVTSGAQSFFTSA